MANPVGIMTLIDGILIDSLGGNPPGVGMKAGAKYLQALGQTSNARASQVANQPVGSVGSPAIATAGTAVSVTVSNTLVTANSYILVHPILRGTAPTNGTASGWIAHWVGAITAGTSFVLWFNSGTALAANAFDLLYFIIN